MKTISKSVIMFSALVAGAVIMGSSAQAAGTQSQPGGAVQIQGNTELNTNVQGGVKQNVKGSNNKATTNVGGIQGTVQIQGNTKVNTNVKGGVVNSVEGSNNESQLNVGGIQGK
ncbi:MAG: hypothetical protein HQL96_05475 [Magnetococcales bacterium]|nr:hypothetical protein [Magnetococcales bacterium]